MNREDRELLAEIARVNCDVAPLVMRITDHTATGDEQRELAERLINVGRRLRERVDKLDRSCVVDNDIAIADAEGLPPIKLREPPVNFSYLPDHLE